MPQLFAPVGIPKAKKNWKSAQLQDILTVLPQPRPNHLYATLNNALLTNFKRSSLHASMAEEKALQYWTWRLQWAPDTATRVWWPGIERALKTQKQSLKI